MTSYWQGPNISNYLRTELEAKALAVAKARYAATGAPVRLSLELEYYGLDPRRNPTLRHGRMVEYSNFVRIIDETRPRRPTGNGKGKRTPPQAGIPSAARNIPKGWTVAPAKLTNEPKLPGSTQVGQVNK